MPEPDARTMQTMAALAANRGTAWRLFGELADTPSPETVARLRDGRFLTDVEQITGWLGDDSPFAPHLSALRAFVARSKRFTLEHDVAAITSEWTRLFGDERPLAGPFRDAADRCEQEAAAWAAGRGEDAKELRLAQYRALTPLLDDATAFCRRLEHDSQVLVCRMLARLLAAQLSAESGRDLVHEVMRPAA